MAASVNSSWTPHGPRNRSLPRAQNSFEMCEEHLNLLAPRLSLRIELRGGAFACEVSDDFVFLAADTAGVGVGAAFGLRRADLTIRFESTIVSGFHAMRISSGIRIIAPGMTKLFAFWTDVSVVVFVPCKISTRPCAVLAF